MPEISSPPPQISIGTVLSRPGVSPGASAEALQGVRDGLAAAAAVAQASSGHRRLPRVEIRLRQGAGANEIAQAVRRAVVAAIETGG